MDFPLGIYLPFIWDCCVWKVRRLLTRTHPVQQAPLCQAIGNPHGWRETQKKMALLVKFDKNKSEKKQTSTVEMFYFFWNHTRTRIAAQTNAHPLLYWVVVFVTLLSRGHDVGESQYVRSRKIQNPRKNDGIWLLFYVNFPCLPCSPSSTSIS